MRRSRSGHRRQARATSRSGTDPMGQISVFVGAIMARPTDNPIQLAQKRFLGGGKGLEVCSKAQASKESAPHESSEQRK